MIDGYDIELGDEADDELDDETQETVYVILRGKSISCAVHGANGRDRYRLTKGEPLEVSARDAKFLVEQSPLSFEYWHGD